MKHLTISVSGQSRTIIGIVYKVSASELSAPPVIESIRGLSEADTLDMLIGKLTRMCADAFNRLAAADSGTFTLTVFDKPVSVMDPDEWPGEVAKIVAKEFPLSCGATA